MRCVSRMANQCLSLACAIDVAWLQRRHQRFIMRSRHDAGANANARGRRQRQRLRVPVSAGLATHQALNSSAARQRRLQCWLMTLRKTPLNNEPLRISVGIDRDLYPDLYDTLLPMGKGQRSEMMRVLSRDGLSMRPKSAPGAAAAPPRPPPAPTAIEPLTTEVSTAGTGAIAVPGNPL